MKNKEIKNKNTNVYSRRPASLKKITIKSHFTGFYTGCSIKAKLFKRLQRVICQASNGFVQSSCYLPICNLMSEFWCVDVKWEKKSVTYYYYIRKIFVRCLMQTHKIETLWVWRALLVWAFFKWKNETVNTN